MTVRILIIEDDAQVQEIYKEALTTEGYEVTLATSGREGLELMRRSTPNLLLLDIMLPKGMNGFDVFEQMKLDPATKNIPVIMLTNLDSEKKTAMDMGAKDYLVKANTTITEVIAKVKKYLV